MYLLGKKHPLFSAHFRKPGEKVVIAVCVFGSWISFLLLSRFKGLAYSKTDKCSYQKYLTTLLLYCISSINRNYL